MTCSQPSRASAACPSGALAARTLDPRPALAHLVPGDRAALAGLLVHPAERPERGLLADLPLRTLDELEHPDRPTLVPAPQREAERGGRLALHLAGVDDDERPVAALPGGQPVVRDGGRLALRHQATSVRASVDVRARTDAASGPAASSSIRSTLTAQRVGQLAGEAEAYRPGLAVHDDRRDAGSRRPGPRPPRPGQVVGPAAAGRPAVGDDDEQRPAARVAEPLGPQDLVGAQQPRGERRAPTGRQRGQPGGRGLDRRGGRQRDVASSPRKVTRPTLSRRWYASRSRESTAPFTADIRARAAIEPEASTTNSTRLASRPSYRASRRSSWRRTRPPGALRPRATWCGAAATHGGRQVQPGHARRAGRPPGSPVRTAFAPGTAGPPRHCHVPARSSRRARNGASGAAAGRSAAGPDAGPMPGRCAAPASASSGVGVGFLRRRVRWTFGGLFAAAAGRRRAVVSGRVAVRAVVRSGPVVRRPRAVRPPAPRRAGPRPGPARRTGRAAAGAAARAGRPTRTSSAVTSVARPTRPCAIAVRAVTMSARMPSTSNAAQTAATCRSAPSRQHAPSGSRRRAATIRRARSASSSAQRRREPRRSASYASRRRTTSDPLVPAPAAPPPRRSARTGRAAAAAARPPRGSSCRRAGTAPRAGPRRPRARRTTRPSRRRPAAGRPGGRAAG